MNLTQLTAAISKIIQDDDYDHEIADRINEAVLKIATGDMLPGRYELSPPLPDLYTTATVDTVVGAGIADLPDDFNRDLFQVVNSDEETITIEPSFKQFLKRYTEISTGDVFKVAAHGSKLLYRDVPAEAETLTVHYYKAPTELSDSTDTPSCIPAHLHRKLIVSHVCKDIFDEIEDGLDDPKINTQHHEKVYAQGLLELEVWAEAEKEPDYINTQGDYCG